MSNLYDYNTKPMSSAYRDSSGMPAPASRKGAGRPSVVSGAMWFFGLVLIAAMAAIVFMLQRGLFDLF